MSRIGQILSEPGYIYPGPKVYILDALLDLFQCKVAYALRLYQETDLC